MTIRFTLCLLGALASPFVSFADTADKESLRKEFLLLLEKQNEVEAQLSKLKALLDLSEDWQDFALIDPSDELSSSAKEAFERGKKKYQEEKYKEAKEAFYLAFEKAPHESALAFNLGLSYHKLGNLSLAKKYIKQAADSDQDLPNREHILAFLKGEKREKEEASSEEKALKTSLTNLKKEADSYMRMANISASKRRKEVVSVLEEMEEKMRGSKVSMETFGLYLADAYLAYELYEDALSVLKEFEESMKGKVLPDGFFAKKFDLEQKIQKREELREELFAKEVDETTKFALLRDEQELKVFAAQMEEFVDAMEEEDPDFSMVCERLGEYRWGNKPNRHVLVANRYQEILYSSLKGTFPLDMYQDAKGRKFLKEIVLTPAEQMKFKEVQLMEVDLNVGGKLTPYIVMYTYLPKHRSFILVRLNKNVL